MRESTSSKPSKILSTSGILLLLVAFGKEEESPTQRYGRGFGVPLSDNEDSGT